VERCRLPSRTLKVLGCSRENHVVAIEGNGRRCRCWKNNVSSVAFTLAPWLVYPDGNRVRFPALTWCPVEIMPGARLGTRLLRLFRGCRAREELARCTTNADHSGMHRQKDESIRARRGRQFQRVVGLPQFDSSIAPSKPARGENVRPSVVFRFPAGSVCVLAAILGVAVPVPGSPRDFTLALKSERAGPQIKDHSLFWW
jgi:hypothetical protein